MNRRVDIEVLSDSWPASTAPPSGLFAAVQSSPSNVDILASLLFLGLWTRPPVTHGFSLSDCWAWLRYFPALAVTPDLRLRDEWTTLDPHHKTVLSGDFGVGFTTWFLSQVLGFVRYSDTLWVVNSLRPGRFHLAPSGKRGPTKSPDYIAEDIHGDFSVLECKGGQSSRTSLRAALDRGAIQKANLRAIGGTTLRHSLVAGLFIPQFNSSESAVLMVADPAWEDVRELFSGFSKEQIARAVVGVSYAKELAMLDLPNVANSLVQAEGSDESLAAALERDRAWRGRRATRPSRPSVLTDCSLGGSREGSIYAPRPKGSRRASQEYALCRSRYRGAHQKPARRFSICRHGSRASASRASTPGAARTS